ncbi:hypothetical protein TTRE_0000030901 [Trichuris trichiura]|uniref:Uncharacterized protein n=1 Tax=Trichuris trichiura TaxID=36087 RepID=A0A077Z0A5_TRITR|nr:hypothetical protein TTRE_0000030901 [Trichuris trichiura]
MAYETYPPICVTAPKNLPSERSVQVEDNVDDDEQEEQFTEFDVVDEDEVEEDSAAATADVIMRNNGGVEGDFDEEIRQLIDNYGYDSSFLIRLAISVNLHVVVLGTFHSQILFIFS